MGEAKFNEEILALKEIETNESAMGAFVATSGDVDTRDKSKQDIVLNEGFETTQCGLKGGKLSGG